MFPFPACFLSMPVLFYILCFQKGLHTSFLFFADLSNAENCKKRDTMTLFATVSDFYLISD